MAHRAPIGYRLGVANRKPTPVYLLVSLLALVAIGPWLTEHLVGRGLWELLLTLVALSSVHMLRVKRGQALISGLLALPTLASLWLRQLVPAVGLSRMALVLLTLFLLYTSHNRMVAQTDDREIASLIRTAMGGAALLVAHQVAAKAVRDALFLDQFPITDLPKIVGAAAVKHGGTPLRWQAGSLQTGQQATVVPERRLVGNQNRLSPHDAEDAPPRTGRQMT